MPVFQLFTPTKNLCGTLFHYPRSGSFRIAKLVLMAAGRKVFSFGREKVKVLKILLWEIGIRGSRFLEQEGQAGRSPPLQGTKGDAPLTRDPSTLRALESRPFQHLSTSFASFDPQMEERGKLSRMILLPSPAPHPSITRHGQ